jgi:hypothetical protein
MVWLHVATYSDLLTYLGCIVGRCEIFLHARTFCSNLFLTWALLLNVKRGVSHLFFFAVVLDEVCCFFCFWLFCSPGGQMESKNARRLSAFGRRLSSENGKVLKVTLASHFLGVRPHPCLPCRPPRPIASAWHLDQPAGMYTYPRSGSANGPVGVGS